MNNKLYVMTFLVVLVLGAIAQAQTFITLYDFTGSSDGADPYAGVIQGSAGNLYGTAEYGGSSYYGVVFEVNTTGTETVLYTFTGGSDGGYPVAPLIQDSKGNLYGTASHGGSSHLGTVFKIDTAGTETVLHGFAGGALDGCYPDQGLLRDKAGNLHGTTIECGSSGNGTVFKIDTAGKESTLHSFTGGPSDGAHPAYGHLLMDKEGNLYGVTEMGGSSGYGALYKLDESGALTLLHSFAGGLSDGCYPYGSVAIDKAGNFYGTTNACGSNSYGTIWKVSKKGKHTILHNFAGRSSDGCYPYGGVALDSKGNLYGVASKCGANGYGALYELSAKGRLALLLSFEDTDGANPYGELWRTNEGTLFGTVAFGGPYDAGTVWVYVP